MRPRGPSTEISCMYANNSDPTTSPVCVHVGGSTEESKYLKFVHFQHASGVTVVNAWQARKANSERCRRCLGFFVF